MPRPPEPDSLFQWTDEDPREPTSETPLETVRQLEKSYGRLIKNQVSMAQATGLIPTDLAKHVKALAELSKTRLRLEKASKETVSPWPERDKVFEERSKKVLSFIGNDADKMIRAANKFLAEMVELCDTIEIDPKTGEVVREIPRKSPGAP